MKAEIYISVDIEASGPIPGEYSMLSIGACLVGNESSSFECFLKPISDKYDPEALRITGFTLESAQEKGLPPYDAMSLFNNWIHSVANEAVPVFVGFNSPFDWSFVNYYFHRYLNENPFGFTALDIKSMFYGKFCSYWQETRSSVISKRLGISQKEGHDALKDAQYQAKIFRRIMNHNEGEYSAIE